MDRQEIENKVWEILDNLGVIERENDKTIIHFEEIDSIQLVSIIVDIEECFNVEIPDEYINPEFLFSFDHIVNVVAELLHDPNTATS